VDFGDVRLACCMSTFDPGGELADCLKSLAASTAKPFLIVVDDGSARPVEIDFAAYGMTGALIRLEHNAGVGAALNVAVREALRRGFRWIARMDSDDVVQPNRFATQLQALQATPAALGVFSAAIAMTEDGEPIGVIHVPPGQRELRRAMARNSALIHPTAMFRREFFERYGLYTTERTYAEDYELFLRPAYEGAFMLCDEPLIYYRVGDNSVSSRNYRTAIRHRAICQAKHLRLTKIDGLGGFVRTGALWIAASCLPAKLVSALRERIGMGWIERGTAALEPPPPAVTASQQAS